MRTPSRIVALAAVVALTGCGWWYNDVPSPDDLMHRVPWFDHMLGSPAVYPYSSAEVPRATPAGTVPITGGELDWFDEWRVGTTTTADRLTNPLAPGAGLVRGDSVFRTFCSPCHGATGAGNGLVGVKMGAPSLLTARAQALSDGYLYSMIRYGRGVMGQYGDKVFDREDRWRVVNYVRYLQQSTAQAEGGN